jgi:hypothetical protein
MAGSLAYDRRRAVGQEILQDHQALVGFAILEGPGFSVRAHGGEAEISQVVHQDSLFSGVEEKRVQRRALEAARSLFDLPEEHVA